jgi:glycosyltransferase involved in cell wall biosynthesis
MENQPKVSVLTPFYNTESYLAEAIESVLAQNYTNFEYLLINNKSTDGSRAIAERYAARDSRIRLLDNEQFVSQIENYNGAFQRIAADAEYVKMVQADDAIYPDCLRLMVEVGELDPRIGLISSYYLYGDEASGSGVPRGVTRMSGREVCRMMLLTKKFLVATPSVLMFRASVVRARTPFFPMHRYHADTEAAYEILLDHDFGFVPQILCFARSDNDSITTRRAQYNPGPLDYLIVIERFGRQVLSQSEFKTVSEREWTYYWGFLGTSALRGRDKSFWKYHQQGLATIDKHIETSTVVAHTLKRVARLALDPIKKVVPGARS